MCPCWRISWGHIETGNQSRTKRLHVCVPVEDLLGIHGDGKHSYEQDKIYVCICPRWRTSWEYMETGKHSYRTGQTNCVYVSPLKNLLGIHGDGGSEQDKTSVCVSASVSVEEPHGNTWRRGNRERNLVPPCRSFWRSQTTVLHYVE